MLGHQWGAYVYQNFIIQSSFTSWCVNKKLATLIAIAPRHHQAYVEIKSFELRMLYISEITETYITETFFKVRNALHGSFPTDKLRSTQLQGHLHSVAPSPFFLSYHWPYKPVRSYSIASWIKIFLASVGIDTQIFEAHSIKSTSTTNAMNSGPP